ncbi:hypothetical protein CYLTODRAFT_429157 [Cylindrobasidium torrendii FP15055 ss-10]|uniref:Uncharacterized protein n=1 Tax=Cylindrobasidium torrendii FP15055 ss-10 TaxID=1314674 RepID=A0A0D7BNL7_9AGAR|nr:hypothetical protein CYLTODRAFT_429157 [Cylindrobasidium torrendii FP15055 ss-10]
MMIAPSSISRSASPALYSPYGRAGSDTLPYVKSLPSPGLSDIHIERGPRTPRQRRSLAAAPLAPLGYEQEVEYRQHVSSLLAAKNAVFSVSGRIPLDPSQLVLFFRTKSGITHSLDFPIDVDYNSPPALDVLIASCRPHQTNDSETYDDKESLFYPPNLPLTTSLEIANHPILQAVQNALFPNLPDAHYLIAARDRLEVVVCGGRMGTQPRMNDGRVATISVTLPVRYRGGALVIRSDNVGVEEKAYGRGGKTGDMEWTAFLADCDYEIETVEKGCRLSVQYGVYLKTFGTGAVGSISEPLINPSDTILDLLSPVLNMSRGRNIAFYLQHEYGVNPAEVLAESLVPMLKGADSVIYHALKLFKLQPILRWTAGGYIWQPEETVEALTEDRTMPIAPMATPMMGNIYSPMRAPISMPAEPVDEVTTIRQRIEASGAIPLTEADITVLADGVSTPAKERVPFVSGPQLEKLCINALIVFYVA